MAKKTELNRVKEQVIEEWLKQEFPSIKLKKLKSF